MHSANANSKPNRTVYAAEHKPDGIYIPPAVGGHATLSNLKASIQTHLNAVYKEIVHRKISFDGLLADMKWCNKTKLLKRDELKLLSQHPGGANIRGCAMEWSDVKEIKPLFVQISHLKIVFVYLLTQNIPKTT